MGKVDTNIPATGGMGAVPPPHAPHEVTQPLQADAGAIVVRDRETDEVIGITSPADRAAEHEQPWRTHEEILAEQAAKRQHVAHTSPGSGHSTGGVAEATDAAAAGKLDPFYERLNAERAAAREHVPPEGAPQPVGDVPHIAGSAGGGALRRSRVIRPGVRLAPVTPAVIADLATGLADVTDTAGSPLAFDEDDVTLSPEALAALRKTHPAASNSDSPHIAEPRRTTRSGLPLDGGWGSGASLQYFALNGDEVRVIAEKLLAEIHTRIQNDLRFSMALMYPRLSIRVVLDVHGFAGGPQSFEIERLRPADQIVDGHEPTPLELAHAVADEVCFTLIAERREVDDQGDPLDGGAPDALRDELGLARPGKHAIGQGGRKQLADV